MNNQFAKKLFSTSEDTNGSFSDVKLDISLEEIKKISLNLDCGDLKFYYVLPTRIITLLIDNKTNKVSSFLGEEPHQQIKSYLQKIKINLYTFLIYSSSGLFLILGVDFDISEFIHRKFSGNPYEKQNFFEAIVTEIKAKLNISYAEYYLGDEVFSNIEDENGLNFFALKI